MRLKLSTYLETLSITLLGLFLLTFPLIFTTLTTDNFSLPKQFALAGVCLILLVLFGLKSVIDKTVRFRRTPFDLHVFLFLVAVLISSVLAENKAESIVAFTSLLFSALLYYLITNTVKSQKAVYFLVGAFIGGAVLTAALSILSFYKVYVLPFATTKSQIFTPVGTLADQAVYIVSALALFLYFALKWKRANKTKLSKTKPTVLALMALGALKIAVLIAGTTITLYSLIKIQNPIILPFATGFQIAFATISQDVNRTILSFLFGSGFGTFGVDFAKFKQSVFNQTAFWNLTFFRSSSFALELMATTGVIGFLSYLNLIYRVFRQKPLFLPLVFLVVLSFLLPFSIVLQTLLFVILGLNSALNGLNGKGYYDVELGLVTLRSGLVAVKPGEKKEVKHGLSRLLPFFVFLFILIFVGALGFYSTKYAMANMTFQKSLAAASQNNGSQAYEQQSKALQLFSYSDAYQRVFSQTNLALANNLSASTKNEASPSAQTQQTIYTLIQQSINSARAATTLSPQSALSWQNLSSVYRSLIGFGKNADSFAILAAQRAIVLDPTNPQQYINLGGLYYQLKDWGKAEEQFKSAINVKPNFANAYYNLAHTLQEKGDLQGALEQLEKVKELVKNDPTNLKKVEAEIASLKAGIGSTTPAPGTPETILPPQDPPVEIPAPSTPPSADPTPTPVASPAPLQ